MTVTKETHLPTTTTKKKKDDISFCTEMSKLLKLMELREISRQFLVGGWTNPIEKYDRQNGWVHLPPFSGWKFQKYPKIFETATT